MLIQYKVLSVLPTYASMAAKNPVMLPPAAVFVIVDDRLVQCGGQTLEVVVSR